MSSFRLPLEVSPVLFKDGYRAMLVPIANPRHVSFRLISRSMRDGKDYDAEWGQAHEGWLDHYALADRPVGFEMTARRLGLNSRRQSLCTDLFFRPRMVHARQLELL